MEVAVFDDARAATCGPGRNLRRRKGEKKEDLALRLRIVLQKVTVGTADVSILAFVRIIFCFLLFADSFMCVNSLFILYLCSQKKQKWYAKRRKEN